MAFNANLEVTDKGTGKITLSGELDASVAPLFRAEVEKAVAQKVKRLALVMDGLDYMSSAGLRALIFAKQKMGANTDVYIIGAQESVMETLTMTGFHNSVIILDSYDAAKIEG
jgi:anti-anti-sigma factor